MLTNFYLRKGIVQSISNLFNDDNLADFTVIVNDSIYKCHRFILGACSQFFNAMFTNNMKEKMDSTAQLHDIDPSAFEIILKMCYTGKSLINDENVPSVWQAADRLQIPFLIELCEVYTISKLSIENFAEFYRVATALDSKSVLKAIKAFILKNFMTVKDNPFLLELSAHELKGFLENDALEVNSEDDVLLSILKWVDDTSYKTSGFTNEEDANECNSGLIPTSENNFISEEVSYQISSKQNTSAKTDIVEIQKPQQKTSDHFQCLLQASRLCLASPQCLQKLYQHRLTQNDEGAKQIIFDAILYQTKGFNHGYFPPAALYRNSSEFEHVGVIAMYSNSFEALSLARNDWFILPDCMEIYNKIKLALFDSSIYAVGEADEFTSKVCVLKESTWATIAEISGIGYFLLSHKSYLYAFNVDSGKVFRMNPNSFDKTPKKLEHKMGFVDVQFAMSYNEYIIVFANDDDVGKEEASVYVMNTLDEAWHRQDNLDGPAKKMASFQDGDKTYLLQRNGNLWSLSADNGPIITFTFIKKIWEAREHLRGALLYKGTLFLYAKLPFASQDSINSVPGIFKSHHLWGSDGYASNFICAVMHKLELVNE